MPRRPSKKIVTISRKRWSRFGTANDARDWGFGGQALLCADGKMCCLGFVCRQALGARKIDIQHCGSVPEEEEVSVPDWYERMRKRAIRINDATTTSDARKEKALKALVRRVKAPIVLKFVP